MRHPSDMLSDTVWHALMPGKSPRQILISTSILQVTRAHAGKLGTPRRS